MRRKSVVIYNISDCLLTHHTNINKLLDLLAFILLLYRNISLYQCAMRCVKFTYSQPRLLGDRWTRWR